MKNIQNPENILMHLDLAKPNWLTITNPSTQGECFRVLMENKGRGNKKYWDDHFHLYEDARFAFNLDSLKYSGENVNLYLIVCCQ